MFSLNGLLAFSLAYIGILAYEYELVLRDENIFQPCDGQVGSDINSFLDMSNLQFKALENESVHCIGTIELIRPIKPETSIQVSIQIYKKNRDTWVNTIYNFQRMDTCYAAFDPTEIWYRYVKYMPKEQQKCPFYTGQKFSFDVVHDLTVNLPDPRVAGDYKGVVLVKFEDVESRAMLCSEFFLTMYRK